MYMYVRQVILIKHWGKNTDSLELLDNIENGVVWSIYGSFMDHFIF